MNPTDPIGKLTPLPHHHVWQGVYKVDCVACEWMAALEQLARDLDEADRDARDFAIKWAETLRELKASQARVAELEADARRYRWLRSEDSLFGIQYYDNDKNQIIYANGDELDAAVDADADLETKQGEQT